MAEFKVKDRVIYTIEGYEFPAKVSGFVEGWVEIEFRDDSRAIVRPSRLKHAKACHYVFCSNYKTGVKTYCCSACVSDHEDFKRLYPTVRQQREAVAKSRRTVAKVSIQRSSQPKR